MGGSVEEIRAQHADPVDAYGPGSPLRDLQAMLREVESGAAALQTSGPIEGLAVARRTMGWVVELLAELVDRVEMLEEGRD